MGIISAKNEKYQDIIKRATNQYILFLGMENQGKKPLFIYQSNLILPIKYPFRSSYQIEKNLSITHHSIQLSKYNVHIPTIQKKWPQSCIGLILCEHHQNHKIQYVYATGILIHKNIVLTSAQNVYCRRLHTEYINIKFLTGVNSNKYSEIYDAMRVHYSKEYTKQEGYEQYDFAVLELYDDLSDKYGYVGLKINSQIKKKQEFRAYRYVFDSNQECFNLSQLKIQDKLKQHEKICSGSGVLLKERKSYYIVGLYMQKIRNYNSLNQSFKNMVNQWTKVAKIEIKYQNFSDTCDQLTKYTPNNLRQISLQYNIIKGVGCKYLSKANWEYLMNIKLKSNYIDALGCKYMSQTNWRHLTNINLDCNKIDSQGCKYLSKSNWKYLKTIHLSYNDIDAQGCKYLSQTIWAHMINVYLNNNKIDEQGCKYISQINWKQLTQIQLRCNRIEKVIDKIRLKALWSKIKL